MIDPTQSEAIAELQVAVRRFQEVRNYKLDPANRIQELLQLLTRVGSLVDRIDPNALGEVPPLIIRNVSRHVLETLKPIEDYLVPAYDPEDAVDATGTVRPQKWARNKVNTSRWLLFLQNLEAQLFEAAQPIFLHQEIRALQLGVATPIAVDYSKSPAVASEENTVLWRYLPLENLERTINRSGLWMSSLTALREWSEKGISDTKEGDVPPILSRLRDELSGVGYDLDATKAVVAKYGLVGEEITSRLQKVLDRVTDHSRVFSSSWSASEEESNLMWSAYGNQGRGIALKTSVGKLARGPWRVPISLSGFGGGPSLHGLMMRKVRYLKFDDEDDVTGFEAEDFYLPFLKRTQFGAEREWRLLALSSNSLSAGGLIIQCDLSALINEIVIGPHANQSDVMEVLKRRSPYLLDTPVRDSIFRPKT